MIDINGICSNFGNNTLLFSLHKFLSDLVFVHLSLDLHHFTHGLDMFLGNKGNGWHCWCVFHAFDLTFDPDAVSTTVIKEWPVWGQIAHSMESACLVVCSHNLGYFEIAGLVVSGCVVLCHGSAYHWFVKELWAVVVAVAVVWVHLVVKGDGGRLS